MEFGIDMAGLSGSFASGVDQIYNAGLWAAMVILLLGLAFLVMFLSRFKNEIVLREVVSGRKIIFRDKFREMKDKQGNIWYQLLKKRVKISVFPSEAVEINHKGKKFVEAYLTQTGEYIPILDKGNSKEIPESIRGIKDQLEKNKAIKKWQKENNVITSLQPFTTNQRVLMVGQLRKAEERRTVSWKEHLIPIVYASSITLIIVCLMVFYGDIAKPMIESKEINQQITSNLREITMIQQDIKNDVQTLKEEQRGQAPS